MFKKHLSWLMSALLLGVATQSFAGMSEAKAKVATPGQIEKQTAQNQVLVHKMMGHINLAQMALDLKLPSEATRQIERAQNIEESLVSKMPKLKLDSSFKYGKVTYDDESVLTDNYIPVVDDVFLVSDYAEIFKHAKAFDINELTAGVRHLGISVDLNDVNNALEKAAADIRSKDYMAARKSLNDTFRNAIVDEEEVDDPELLLSENIALAKSFVDQGQYDSARLTLKHVQDRLKLAEQGEIPGVDKATLEKFSTDLDNMRAELRMKDPSLSQRLSDRLTSLGKTISGWFS